MFYNILASVFGNVHKAYWFFLNAGNQCLQCNYLFMPANVSNFLNL
jgi:hypothetical protein